MSSPPHALTGLVSYVLRTAALEYICDPATKSTSYVREAGLIYLWMPEEVETRVAELERKLPWAGRLTAVRSRA